MKKVVVILKYSSIGPYPEWVIVQDHVLQLRNA